MSTLKVLSARLVPVGSALILITLNMPQCPLARHMQHPPLSSGPQAIANLLSLLAVSISLPPEVDMEASVEGPCLPAV